MRLEFFPGPAEPSQSLFRSLNTEYHSRFRGCAVQLCEGLSVEVNWKHLSWQLKEQQLALSDVAALRQEVGSSLRKFWLGLELLLNGQVGG